MQAIKDNKVYKITTDEEVKTYQAQGYDIYDNDGNIKEYGAGKSVPIGDYKKLEAEKSQLTAENKKLKAEIAKIKKAEEK